MHLGRNKVAAQATSKIYVGLSLLTSFEPHHLVSLAFVLSVYHKFTKCSKSAGQAQERLHGAQIWMRTEIKSQRSLNLFLVGYLLAASFLCLQPRDRTHLKDASVDLHQVAASTAALVYAALVLSSGHSVMQASDHGLL